MGNMSLLWWSRLSASLRLATGEEGRGSRVTWLGCGGGGSVPRQQVHQQLSLPAPHGVGVWVEVGVGVGEAATCPRRQPVSVPSPGPGAHAVLAFVPPQPFSQGKIVDVSLGKRILHCAVLCNQPMRICCRFFILLCQPNE